MNNNIPNINPSIYTFFNSNLLYLVAGWGLYVGGLFSFSLFRSKKYVVKSDEDHRTLFNTRNKGSQSVKVFSRVCDVVFNAQPDEWHKLKARNPLTVIDSNWINSKRGMIHAVVNNKVKSGPLYEQIQRIVYGSLYSICFDTTIDWNGYKQFLNQAPSINRQLMYSFYPISPFFYWGRRQWYKMIDQQIKKAGNHSIVKELERQGVDLGDHLRGELSGIFWGGMFSLTNVIAVGLYYACRSEYIKKQFEKNPDETAVKILQEALRIQAGAPILFRSLDKDTQLEEHKLKKGDSVALCPFALHRDPTYWSDPEQFKLDRHPKNSFYHTAFIPFGTPITEGGRECAGKELAIMIATTVIKTLMKEYTITITGDELTCEPYCGAQRIKSRHTALFQKK